MKSKYKVLIIRLPRINITVKLFFLYFSMASFFIRAENTGTMNSKLIHIVPDQYEIIIKNNAPQTTVFAAGELSGYFKKVTGHELTVKTSLTAGKKGIFIGHNNILPKEDRFNITNYSLEEKFLIDEIRENIIIMGADCDVDPAVPGIDNFSLLFGVYEFIERFLGVRWYAPGELGECYVKKDKIIVSGMPIEQRPKYWKRSYWPSVFYEATVSDSVLWGRRMKGFGCRPFTPNHSMKDLEKVFGDTRPQIYALNPDGSRHFGINYSWPHFCFSHPDTLKSLLEMIDAYYQNTSIGKLWKNVHPDSNYIYIVPNDNFLFNQCCCKECQAKTDKTRGTEGMQSDLVWQFVVQAANELKKNYPEKKVVALAYQGFLLSPRGITFPDNVIVQICYIPYIIFSGLPAYEKKIEDIITAWSKLVKEISVWHYYLPFGDYPFIMPSKLAVWYKTQTQIKSCFMELTATKDRRSYLPDNQHHTGNVGTCLAQVNLNLYFSMKAMWGSDFDSGTELDEYYKNFFGTAEIPMKEFHQLAISRWEKITDVEAKNIYNPRISGKDLYENIYNEAVVKKFTELFEKAEKLTASGSIFRKRLEWIRQSYLDSFFSNARAFYSESKISKNIILFSSMGKPVIDGSIDESFWKNREDFIFKRNDAPLPPRFASECKFGLDQENLYFAIKADDPDSMSQLLVCNSSDSQVYKDDSYEIFICPEADKPEIYYHICVNLKDIVFDELFNKEKKGDITWNSGIVSKTQRNNGNWTAECSLPLKNMKLDINETFKWRLNLCRNKKSGVAENHEMSQWCPTYGSFHNITAMPLVNVVSRQDGIFENFENSLLSDMPLSFMLYDQSMPNGKKVDDFSSCTAQKGRLVWNIDFPAQEFISKNYASLQFKKFINSDIKNSYIAEIKFLNADTNILLLAAYSFNGADEKKYSDFFRLSIDASPQWQIKSFNIQTEGVQALLKKTKDIDFAPPVQINQFAIYAKSKGAEKYSGNVQIAYIRFTGKPIKEQ
ncbi:MAG TPA: hypothetical protein DC049_06365 [Spirochaetia bacterium]|nr:hypothetical protein [Spirochaetia bacterium]